MSKSIRWQARLAKIFQVHTEDRQGRYQYSSRSEWPIKLGYYFPLYWDHKYPHVPSATGSIKQKEITRAIYFANASIKVFCWKKSSRKHITVMLHCYPKTSQVQHGYIPIRFIHQALSVSTHLSTQLAYPFTNILPAKISCQSICHFFICQFIKIRPFINI